MTAQRVLTPQLAQHIDQEVMVRGWIQSRRDLGGVQFLILRDKLGTVQCVANHFSSPLPESCVEVVGTVQRHPKAPGGLEIHATHIQILSEAIAPTPIEISKQEWHTQPETLFDYRYVSLRNPRERAALRVQAVLVSAFRSSLMGMGFTEIFTPKIVSAGAEGGAHLFELDYFGQPAYLAQSPQLYKQIMVGVFERVFETAPVYRAEEHATSRHLNEYLSLDVEMGFIDSEEDVMNVEETVLKDVCKALREGCVDEFALYDAPLPDVPERIPRISLLEARELCKTEFGYTVQGKDLDPEGERLVCQYFEQTQGSPWVFVTQYPKVARPFYTYPEGELTRGFDLLYKGIEITSGGQRIHRYDALIQSLEERHMAIDAFKDYLEVFKHGMPPHGGFAIGAERLTARFLNIQNVRHARAFPRDRHRLTP